ncbi:hypothetical protein PoB_000291700 [Plakobranchus ocellatus]|uniref:Uncharacterized protein n=1 Tax=Plakobranchus ocellatus TaxID=259542 RepID=A0AAV3Y0Y0_9GAST|nr:hypothetical protein PoB_000291700 [Plakobranchus ocellatus]
MTNTITMKNHKHGRSITVRKNEKQNESTKRWMNLVTKTEKRIKVKTLRQQEQMRQRTNKRGRANQPVNKMAGRDARWVGRTGPSAKWLIH